MKTTVKKQKPWIRFALAAVTLTLLLLGIFWWMSNPSERIRARIDFAAIQEVATKEPPGATRWTQPRTSRELLDAVGYLERALTLQKARLGPDHPLILADMNELANDYAALGRHTDALKLYEQTLALQKAKLGPDHPDVFAVINNMGNSYIALDRFAEALTLYKQTLPLQITKFGPDHADTLRIMHNLANCFAALGEHEEALKLREELLARRQATLGFDHLDTIASMNNLANTYSSLGRFADALALHEETLALQKTKLGPEHQNALLSMRSIAVCLYELGRGGEAVPIIDQCIEKAAGKTVHPRLMMDIVDTRLRHFQRTMDAKGCRATAEIWEKMKRADANSLYQAACFRAVTAAVIRVTDESNEGASLAGVEVERAMHWLREAVAAGYKDVEFMKKDQDLDALKDQAEFQKILAALETGN